MKKNGKNEELQSRREFFKRAAVISNFVPQISEN